MSNAREVWERLQRAQARLTPEGRAVWDVCAGSHPADAEIFNAAGKAAIEARWPEEPTPEMISIMIEVYGHCRRDPDLRVNDMFAKVYAGLRAHILGENA